jgi:hypothetical protein
MPCQWVGVNSEDPDRHLPALIAVSQLWLVSPAYLTWWGFLFCFIEPHSLFLSKKSCLEISGTLLMNKDFLGKGKHVFF